MSNPSKTDHRYFSTRHVHNIGTVKVTDDRTEYPCVTCGGTVQIPTRRCAEAGRRS